MAWRSLKREFPAEIISGGRITVPKNIRRVLKLKPGMVVNVTIDVREQIEEEPEVAKNDG